MFFQAFLVALIDQPLLNFLGQFFGEMRVNLRQRGLSLAVTGEVRLFLELLGHILKGGIHIFGGQVKAQLLFAGAQIN